MTMSDDSAAISRRTFVRDTGRAAAALAMAPMIVPRHVLGGLGFRAPSRTLNVACVGIGGMGMANMNVLVQSGENIVAVCDVDFGYVERSLAGRLRPPQGQTSSSPEALRLKEAYEKAAKYDDFRVMLERQKDIDAVVIATPDHTHGVIANLAMKAGKHVYVQKPLTYSVHEARLLARTARETRVVTQMGNQGHSQEGTRRIVEVVGAGVIGPVREVHVWTDRPQRYWAQGIPRPVRQQKPIAGPILGAPAAAVASSAGTSSAAAQAGAATGAAAPPRWSIRTVDNAILQAMAENPQSPPPGLRWDLFLGPAPDVPYHPVYHPFSWRGWPEFGVSAIGDMGAHLLDQPFWALELGSPSSVIASSTPWGGTPAAPGAYPLAMTARFEFPARGARPPVSLSWYDGGLLPPLPEEIVMPRADGGGGVMIGERGYLTYETYGSNLLVYPDAAAARAAVVPKTLPRIEVPHEVNWAQACKGEAVASCPFEYAAPLTELMLLGVVALRAGQSRQILYDGAGMNITNIPGANAYLTREFRGGWFPG
jgi:predicted dehydrogenase